MHPRQHFFFGIFFSLFLFFIFPKIELIEALIVLASTVLIDVDHYIHYVFTKKNLSLRKAINWHHKKIREFTSLTRENRNKSYIAFCLFHGIEISILLFFGIFLSHIFLFIFAGAAFHLLLDIICQPAYQDRIDKVSLVFDFFKFKKLKCIGKN